MFGGTEPFDRGLAHKTGQLVVWQMLGGFDLNYRARAFDRGFMSCSSSYIDFKAFIINFQKNILQVSWHHKYQI